MPLALFPPHALFRLPRPAPRPALYALLSTRQSASAFNQPLTFDTSSVTDMGRMFYVRSALASCPHAAFSWTLRVRAACVAASTPRPPAVRPASRHEPHAPSFDPAQDAYAFNRPLSFDTSSVTGMSEMFSSASPSAFNQPLSFDTSSVTGTNGMFYVCFSPCPAPVPICSRALSCTLLAPRPPAASRLPACIPHPAPHALLPTLGRPRRRSTSR